MTSELVILGLIIILSLIIGAAYVAFYERAGKYSAMVRTGFGGERIVIDSGCFVVPVLHDLSRVTLSTFEITVESGNEKAFSSKDGLLLDVQAAFLVSIPADPTVISRSARDFDRHGNISSESKKYIETTFLYSISETIKNNSYITLNERIEDLVINAASKKTDDLGLIINSASVQIRIIPEITKDKIERSISFSSEYKQSGIAMLNYFSEILSKKYPKMDVIVTIQQHSNNVIVLVIETPEGNIETIEHELSMYGQVLSGSLAPEEYFSKKQDVLELTNKMELAQLEIKQKNALLRNDKKHYVARIKEQNETIDFLKDILDTQIYNNSKTLGALRKLSLNHQKGANKSIKKLIEALEVGSTDKKIIAKCLEEIIEEDPSVIDSFNELILKGSIQGASGNILYECMKSMHLLV